jgi:phage-related protein
MGWVVEVLDIAVPELRALPEDMQAHFSRMVQLIQTLGLERMREPWVKHLEERLWEIRLSGRDGIARAIYVTARGRRVVVVRVFAEKTQKTPRGELDLARWRAKDIL